MTRTLLSVLLVSFVLAPLGFGEEEASLAVRVNRAIGRGARSLVERQDDDGSWRKDDKHHPLGRTALCTYALLHAGYPEDHPAVKKALAFLGVSAGYHNWKKARSTYEATCLVLMLNALGKVHGPQIREICTWLCENFNETVGLWGYPDGTPDLSNTQYAAMALKVGERHGFRAPKGLWKRLVDSVIRMQSKTGGMRYRGATVYSASMTHAGLLILLFAQQAMGLKSPTREMKAALDKGHRWYADNYDVERNPSGRGWRKGAYYYYMYGLERYAVFFGLTEVAGHDWYEEGAEVLLGLQERNGRWGNHEQTSFAILFLRKATFTEPEVRVFGTDEDEGRKDDRPKRPRPADDVKGLRDWLVAGPFLGEAGEDDQLFARYLNTKKITPVEGGPAGKMKWVRYTSPEDKVDLAIPLRGKAWSCFYAAVFLHAEKEMDAVLWLDSDDGLKAWLNGEEILFGHHHNHCGKAFYRVPITLSKGRNLALLQVENLEHYVYFTVRLTEPGGKALEWGVLDSTKPRLSKRR